MKNDKFKVGDLVKVYVSGELKEATIVRVHWLSVVVNVADEGLFDRRYDINEIRKIK